MDDLIDKVKYNYLTVRKKDLDFFKKVCITCLVVFILSASSALFFYISKIKPVEDEYSPLTRSDLKPYYQEEYRYYNGFRFLSLVCLIGGIFTFSGFKSNEIKIKMAENNENDELNAMLKHEKDKINRDNKQKEYSKTHNIPLNAEVINHNKGMSANITKRRFYFWFDKPNKQLFFVDTNFLDSKGKFVFDSEKILSFSRLGDFYVEQSISGGGGGGSSIGKAIVGGVIAGGAGAVVASRNKIEEIKTTNKVVDKRETILEVLDENNNKQFIFFESEVYNVFLDVMPEKEISVSKGVNSNNNEDVYAKIQKLAKLKDEGILTEEEFTTKKRDLLDKIN